MTITYRLTKGSQLTYQELDANFQDVDTRLKKSDKLRGGWHSVIDVTTQSTPISYTGGSGTIYLTNDGADARTTADYLPDGVTSLWDTSTNRFDFSELPIGSILHINTITTFITSAANQEIVLQYIKAIGDTAEEVFPLWYGQFKTAGTYTISNRLSIPIADTSFTTLPGGVQFSSPNDCSIKVYGWFLEAYIRGEIA